MELISFWQVLLVVTLLLIVFGARDVDSYWQQLHNELKRRVPIYSAETTQGKEAEFIRDRLPKRFPRTVILLAFVVCGAAAWWLTR